MRNDYRSEIDPGLGLLGMFLMAVLFLGLFKSVQENYKQAKLAERQGEYNSYFVDYAPYLHVFDVNEPLLPLYGPRLIEREEVKIVKELPASSDSNDAAMIYMIFDMMSED